MINWLQSEICTDLGGSVTAYPRDKIPESYEIIPLVNGSILVLDKQERWIKFAVLEFYCSDMDDKNTMYTSVFHGEGPSGNLRQCRHTMWGDGGFLYCLVGLTITAALKELSKYYDNLTEEKK